MNLNYNPWNIKFSSSSFLSLSPPSLIVVQVLLYIYRNRRLFRDREPRMATFTFTLPLSYGRGPFFCWVTTVNLIPVPLSVLKGVYTAHTQLSIFGTEKILSPPPDSLPDRKKTKGIFSLKQRVSLHNPPHTVFRCRHERA